MVEFNLLQKIVLWAIPIIFAITVHEVAHGWVANKLGDPTAKMMGRLTLNPIKHIDLIGTIILPAILIFIGGFIFGWAKPVPITWNNLRNPKRDVALVAVAGPLSNLLMALGWALIAKLGLWLIAVHGIKAGIPIYYMSQMGIMINSVLFILNLFPLPPLDGSRIMSSFLSPKAAYYYGQIEPYGFLILLALLVLGVLNKLIFPLVYALSTFINAIFGLPTIG